VQSVCSFSFKLHWYDACFCFCIVSETVLDDQSLLNFAANVVTSVGADHLPFHKQFL